MTPHFARKIEPSSYGVSVLSSLPDPSMTSPTCFLGLAMVLAMHSSAPSENGAQQEFGWPDTRIEVRQDVTPRSPEVILRDFAAVVLPSFSDGNSPEARAAFEAAVREGCALQAALALELWTVQPEHVEVPRLMNVRWMGLCNVLDQAIDVDREVAPFLLADTPRPLRRQAHWARAHARLALDSFEGRPRRKAIQAAIALDPQNERGARYLAEYVVHHASDMDGARTLCERILDRYGEACAGGRVARRCLRAFESLGSAFPWELSDFRTGAPIRSENELGRPVLVHTWSGDLEQNAVTLEGARQLQTRYGIECIGVATFAPGAGEAALEAELESRGVDWPIAIDVVDAARPWITNWRAPLADGYFLFDGEGALIAIGSDLRVMRANVERVMPSRIPQR